MTVDVALDRFFASFYAGRPVTATFTGIHDHDMRLPDWSPDGLEGGVEEMQALRADLAAAASVEGDAAASVPGGTDLTLADSVLEIQIAEHQCAHFYQRNPALWTGEAIFSILSLVTRPFAALEDRLAAASARLTAVPRFLADARHTLISSPAEWRARALRECDAAAILFGRSLPAWLPETGVSAAAQSDVAAACRTAFDAFQRFAAWLRDDVPTGDQRYALGGELLSLLVRRGHHCSTPLDELATTAHQALADSRLALDRYAREQGADWSAMERQIAAAHPTADDYLPRFTRTWQRFRRAADDHDLVTWPDAPIRYAPIPSHTREAAPLLYYLLYRSPAPFDPAGEYEYVVPPLDGLPADEVLRRLTAANDCAIALNHVVHHGGLGHHVQNACAVRGGSRIGRVAAVDGASRIAMFCGGSLAEGWACYACDLMEEAGVLTALERASLLHTRVRLATRAVVDLALHTGRMSLDQAAAFFHTQGLMTPATALAEAVKASMFPGTAMMYWLGTSGIHALRRQLRIGDRGRPSRRWFHDRFLSFGAIPVPVIAHLMSREA